MNTVDSLLNLRFDKGFRQLSVGLDGVYRTTHTERIGFLNGPVAVKGSWEDNSFLLEIQFLNGVFFGMRFDFSELDVDIHQLLARKTIEIRGSRRDQQVAARNESD
jgi:hypothetical protein